jgi:hypothetical protein
MYDEMQQLREVEELYRLLSHYAEVGAADRLIWQDRLTEMEGVQPRDLIRLHGELLAFGWLEQNTGLTPTLRPGVALGCYRITPSGLRARKDLHEERKAALAAS